jgi:hypothetical protein
VFPRQPFDELLDARRHRKHLPQNFFRVAGQKQLGV